MNAEQDEEKFVSKKRKPLIYCNCLVLNNYGQIEGKLKLITMVYNPTERFKTLWLKRFPSPEMRSNVGREYHIRAPNNYDYLHQRSPQIENVLESAMQIGMNIIISQDRETWAIRNDREQSRKAPFHFPALFQLRLKKGRHPHTMLNTGIKPIYICIHGRLQCHPIMLPLSLSFGYHFL